MPELILYELDRQRMIELLASHKRPRGVRHGTWVRLMRWGDLETLEMFELRAVARAEPEIMRALGLPEVLP